MYIYVLFSLYLPLMYLILCSCIYAYSSTYILILQGYRVRALYSSARAWEFTGTHLRACNMSTERFRVYRFIGLIRLRVLERLDPLWVAYEMTPDVNLVHLSSTAKYMALPMFA